MTLTKEQMNFVLPDGKTLRESNGHSVERLGRWFNDVGKIVKPDATLDDHKSEVLECLIKHYPEIPEGQLKMWYATSIVPF